MADTFNSVGIDSLININTIILFWDQTYIYHS